MTFSQKESSRYLGEPVNLYLFRFGDAENEIFAYTDAEQVITVDGIDYTPMPIDRGKINSSGGLDKTNVTVITPANTPLARLYLIYPPSKVTTVIMRAGHLTDPDLEFKVIWTGRVLSCARKGAKAEFTCEPVSTSLRRNGLRRRWQFGCPHALYGPECGANKAAATISVTVANVTGVRVLLPLDWETEMRAPKYLGGMVQWVRDGATEIRTIIRVENSGRTLVLSGPATGLIPGATISAILGCNHKSGTPAQPDGDCGPLHGNVLNFGGQEHIPFKNPIALVNNYYGAATASLG